MRALRHPHIFATLPIFIIAILAASSPAVLILPQAAIASISLGLLITTLLQHAYRRRTMRKSLELLATLCLAQALLDHGHSGIAHAVLKDARLPRRPTLVSEAPGSWLPRVFKYLVGRKAVDLIVRPILLDMHTEYIEALHEGASKPYRAAIIFRGYLAVFQAAGLSFIFKLGRLAWDAWRMSK